MVKRLAVQQDRIVQQNELILEQSLDGDVVVTYSGGVVGTSYAKLPVEEGVVTGRSYFDHEYFDTTIRPALEHAGFEVAVTRYEEEKSGSIFGRIKTLITR